MEWERRDTYLVSAHSPDCIVRVWRSSTGELVSKLKGTKIQNLTKVQIFEMLIKKHYQIRCVYSGTLTVVTSEIRTHTIMWTLHVVSNNYQY